MKAPITALMAAALVACTAPPAAERPARTAPPPEPRTAIVERAKAQYDVARTFPGGTADTLLADIITFIHKRPAAAVNQDRTDPAFRHHYLQALPQYRMVYHHADTDGTHWFYLVRPARSVDGDRRGVGGRFTIDDRMALVEFEEIFNTPVLPEAELEDKGLALFRELIATGNVTAYMEDRSFIEWPDDRLKYDVERREWRYTE